MSNLKSWTLNHRKEAILILIIFIVATLSFGLGYLANREFSHAPIIIQNNPSE